MKKPMPEERATAGATRRMSASVARGSSWPTFRNSSRGRIFSTSVNTSERANRPIKRGIRPMPPIRSVLPKVKRCAPDIGSRPMQAIRKPNPVLNTALGACRPDTLAIVTSASR